MTSTTVSAAGTFEPKTSQIGAQPHGPLAMAALHVDEASERLLALEWVFEQIEDAWVRDIDNRLLLAAHGCVEAARALLEKATAALDAMGDAA